MTTTIQDECDIIKADLLDALAILERVRAAYSQPEPARVVPYRSQWEADAARFASDCGPACVAMIVEHATGQRVPIDQLSAECKMNETHKYTLDSDLILGASAHGVKLACMVVSSIEMARLPCIALVHYGSLTRMDTAYTKGHWVVVTAVTGNVTYHDPDWWGDQVKRGENRAEDIEAFDQAMRDCALDGNAAGLVLVHAQEWYAGR